MQKKKGGAPKGHPPYNKNGEGGRPKKWNGEKIEELAESLDKWIDEAVEFKNQFWWWDWCFDVGLDQSKVSKIAKENQRFCQSYERAKFWQESIVGKGALIKEFSEGFSKFFLINHYPDTWKEKSEKDTGITPELYLKYETLTSEIRAAQKSASALREAKINQNTDCISE